MRGPFLYSAVCCLDLDSLGQRSWTLELLKRIATTLR